MAAAELGVNAVPTVAVYCSSEVRGSRTPMVAKAASTSPEQR